MQPILSLKKVLYQEARNLKDALAYCYGKGDIGLTDSEFMCDKNSPDFIESAFKRGVDTNFSPPADKGASANAKTVLACMREQYDQYRNKG